jgi:hypothetical protein
MKKEFNKGDVVVLRANLTEEQLNYWYLFANDDVKGLLTIIRNDVTLENIVKIRTINRGHPYYIPKDYLRHATKKDYKKDYKKYEERI